MLAGGDGAGKSTFHRQRLEPLDIAFVNAGLIAKDLDAVNRAEASDEAARLARSRYADLSRTARHMGTAC